MRLDPRHAWRRLHDAFVERPSSSRTELITIWRGRSLKVFGFIMFLLGLAELTGIFIGLLPPLVNRISLALVLISEGVLLLALLLPDIPFRTRYRTMTVTVIVQSAVFLLAQGYADSTRTRLFATAFVAAVLVGPLDTLIMMAVCATLILGASALAWHGTVSLGQGTHLGLWTLSNLGFLVVSGFVSSIVAAIVSALERSAYQESEALRALQASHDALSAEVSVRRRAEAELSRRSEMDHLVAEISRRLAQVSPDPGRVAASIEWVMARLGEHTGIDWTFCGLLDNDWHVSRLYTWHHPARGVEVASPRDLPDRLPPALALYLSQENALHVPDTAAGQHQPGFPLEQMVTLGLRAVLIVPMLRDGALYGFLGQACLGETHQWASEDISLTRTVANAIMSAHERLVREAALRESEVRYRTLVENSALGIGSIDTDGHITAANHKLAEMVQLTRPEQTVGLGVQHIPTLSEAGFADALFACLAAGQATASDYAYVLPDGSRFEYRGYATPILDSENQLTGVHLILEDTGEQRLIELQLQQASKMEALGRLAGGVAHDFNNLLTVINGYAQLALSSGMDLGPVADDLDAIESAGHRAAALTRQLLSFSRQQSLELQPVDLNEVLQGLHKMLGRLIGEDVVIEIVTQEGLPLIEADPGQIEQVVFNLAVNARDAMPTGGRLTLATRVASEQEGPVSVVMAVQDNGQGIPPEIRQRIFDPFFTTKAPGRGTGLGLSTVYGIVAQFGGHIDVESTVGRGTTFYVHLPAIQSEPAAPVPSPLACPVLRGHEHILLVEDDDGVRGLTVALLEGLGYAVTPTASGDEAISMLKTESAPQFDLILSDVVMPGLSGAEFVALARVLRPHTPVLLMSGYPDDVLSDQGVLDASYRFIAKPFTVQQLAETVRTVMTEPIA